MEGSPIIRALKQNDFVLVLLSWKDWNDSDTIANLVRELTSLNIVVFVKEIFRARILEAIEKDIEPSKIVSKNPEHICFLSQGDEKKKVLCLRDNVRTTRGTGGDVIIYHIDDTTKEEEAKSTQFFFKIIVPILSLQNVKFIALSHKKTTDAV